MNEKTSGDSHALRIRSCASRNRSRICAGGIPYEYTESIAVPTTRPAMSRPSEEVEGGERMCVIKLRRPLSIEEYREAHHPDTRPLVKHMDAGVVGVLLPASMVCTIPDYMEVE